MVISDFIIVTVNFIMITSGLIIKLFKKFTIIIVNL